MNLNRYSWLIKFCILAVIVGTVNSNKFRTSVTSRENLKDERKQTSEYSDEDEQSHEETSQQWSSQNQQYHILNGEQFDLEHSIKETGYTNSPNNGGGYIVEPITYPTTSGYQNQWNNGMKKSNYEQVNYEQANYEQANYEQANYEPGNYEQTNIGQTNYVINSKPTKLPQIHCPYTGLPLQMDAQQTYSIGSKNPIEYTVSTPEFKQLKRLAEMQEQQHKLLHHHQQQQQQPHSAQLRVAPQNWEIQNSKEHQSSTSLIPSISPSSSTSLVQSTTVSQPSYNPGIQYWTPTLSTSTATTTTAMGGTNYRSPISPSIITQTKYENPESVDRVTIGTSQQLQTPTSSGMIEYIKDDDFISRFTNPTYFLGSLPSIYPSRKQNKKTNDKYKSFSSIEYDYVPKPRPRSYHLSDD